MGLEDSRSLSFLLFDRFPGLSIVFYDVVLFVNCLVAVIEFCLSWVVGEVRRFDVLVGACLSSFVLGSLHN